MYNKHEEIFSWNLVSIAEGTPAFSYVRVTVLVVRRGHVPNVDSVVIDCVYKDSKIRTIHVLPRTLHNTA